MTHKIHVRSYHSLHAVLLKINITIVVFNLCDC